MEAQEAEQQETEAQEAEAAPEAQAKPEQSFDASYVKSLRAENAKFRKAAKSAEEALKAREDAERTELEKAQNRVSELEQQGSTTASAVQELRVENAVLRQA